MASPRKQPHAGSAKGDAGQPLDATTSFESALAEVESIVERIEAGEIGLEESLAAYEHGVALIAHCRGKLDRAQKQVHDLTRKLKDETGGGGEQQQGSPPDSADEDR